MNLATSYDRMRRVFAMGLRLGIDLDGVVADFNRGWTAAYNQHFGARLHAGMVQTWNSPLELTHFLDMDAFWAWARDHEGHSVFRYLEPYPGALETLRMLHRDGHQLVVISAKPDWAVPDTLTWIAEHGVPTRELHFTEDKHEVVCDVYLDDAPGQLARLADAHADRAQVCRFVRPWNRPVQGVRDVADWEQFHHTVRQAEAAPVG